MYLSLKLIDTSIVF